MYNIKNGLDFLTLPNPFIYKALLIADNIQYYSEMNMRYIQIESVLNIIHY